MESLLLFGPKAFCCHCGLLFPAPACFVSFPLRPARLCSGVSPARAAQHPRPSRAPSRKPRPRKPPPQLTGRARESDPSPSSCSCPRRTLCRRRLSPTLLRSSMPSRPRNSVPINSVRTPPLSPIPSSVRFFCPSHHS